MPGTVEIDGVAVWYDDVGEGEPLVLLHPGLVDARVFAPNLPALAEHFHVFTPDRRGHGHTPDVDGPLTYDDMARETARFIELVIGGPVRLMGHSDGAIVAMLTTLKWPQLVRQLVCASAPFHHDGWLPEAIDPDAEPPEFFATSYGEVSPDGIEHFPVVVDKLRRAHHEGPTLQPAQLADVACRTLVMVADDDEVTLEHAIEFYRSLPRGELAVVPGTSHGLLVEKPDLCHAILLDFLTKEPTPLLAPIRRAIQLHS